MVQVIFLTKRKLKGRSEDYLSDRDTSPYSHTTIINEIITWWWPSQDNHLTISFFCWIKFSQLIQFKIDRYPISNNTASNNYDTFNFSGNKKKKKRESHQEMCRTKMHYKHMHTQLHNPSIYYSFFYFRGTITI